MNEEDVKWVELFERHAGTLVMWQVTAGVKHFPEVLGVDFAPQNIKNDRGKYYRDAKELKKEQKVLTKKYKEDPTFFDETFERAVEMGKELPEVAEQASENIENETNEELVEDFREFNEKFMKFSPIVWVCHTIEKILEKSIRKKLEKKFSSSEKQDKYFNVLTNSDRRTSASEEQEELLKIAAEYKEKGSFDSEIEKKINDIYEKYNWLGAVSVGWNYLKDPYSLDHYKETIKELAEENPEQQLDEKREQRKQTEEEYEKLSKEIDDERLLRDCKVLGKYVWLRTARGEFITRMILKVRDLLNEIASRIDIEIDDLIWFTPEEIIEALESGELPDFESRKNGYKLILLDGKATVSGKVKQAREEKAVELEGQGVVGGNVKEQVKIIKDVDELDKFQKNNVLITEMTSPDMMQAIRKASAIVTDEGGMTSHAVVISRELGVPCVIGTQDATETFEDEDWVKVNADEGEVLKVEQEYPPIYNKLSIALGYERTFIKAKEFFSEAEDEILILSVGEKVPEEINNVLKERHENGVGIRFIASKYDEDNASMVEKKNIWADEIRHHSRFGKFTFGIIDTKSGFLSLRDPESQEDRITLYFRDEDIAKNLKQYFEEAWGEAEKINVEDK